MSVFTLGLNHTTAPVDLRGRFAFSPEQLSPALRGFRERLARALPEAALLSTCNRTELYVAADPAQVQALQEFAEDFDLYREETLTGTEERRITQGYRLPARYTEPQPAQLAAALSEFNRTN